MHGVCKEMDEITTCAVCLDATELTMMPCCGTEAASTRFCLRCLQVICEMAPEGRGRCPNCRTEIMVAEGHLGHEVVKAPVNMGRCRVCCQGNKVIVEKGMCGACALGSRHALRYECDRCHRTQRIAHPMWRYQPAPGQYGSATWACHQRCGDYTHWRVLPNDLSSVPAWDRPQLWGLADPVIAEVRQHRQRELVNSPNGVTPVTEGPDSRRHSGCNIS